MYRKNHIKIYQTIIIFLFKKRFEVNKKIFILVKLWEIEIIVFMITLTRSSLRIFNPMHFTDFYTISYKSENGKYGLILVWIDETENGFLFFSKGKWIIPKQIYPQCSLYVHFSIFICFANSSCDWLEYVTWFISANSCCYL